MLDEPSAGLHPADAEPLLEVLDRLKAAGNSLFVVEHDMDVVRRADWVVDVGPGAGDGGGRVLYSGPVAGLEDVEESATSATCSAEPSRSERDATRSRTGWLHLRGVTRHNLRDVSVDVPLGVLTAVTGVSGSGKSTLVTQVLGEVVRGHLGLAQEERRRTSADARDRRGRRDRARGVRPAGAGGPAPDRPHAAVEPGDLHRDVRRGAQAVRRDRRGAGSAATAPGRFSFNVAGGRCETCQGEGFVAVELLFLPGTYAPCPTCHGARYNAETLEVTYAAATIADVLAMTVDEAATFLADVPARRAQPRDAAGGRPRLPAPGPAGDRAVRR